jgi:hypothetical protein
MRTNAKQPSPALEQEFIRVLPFYLQPICDDQNLEIPMPAAHWRSATNVCEGAGSRCDDGPELYYSIAGDAVTWWCPRHWYESCLAPGAPYRLLDMTAEQYAEERSAQKERFRKDWDVVSERIRSSASILSRAGLQEQAGTLWEAHGSIRSGIARL